jgi:hypothetical protein
VILSTLLTFTGGFEFNMRMCTEIHEDSHAPDDARVRNEVLHKSLCNRQ